MMLLNLYTPLAGLQSSGAAALKLLTSVALAVIGCFLVYMIVKDIIAYANPNGQGEPAWKFILKILGIVLMIGLIFLVNTPEKIEALGNSTSKIGSSALNGATEDAQQIVDGSGN